MTNETNFSETAEDMHAAASNDDARRDAEENAEAMREAREDARRDWEAGWGNFSPR